MRHETTVRGRLQFEMIEYRLRISAYVAVGRGGLDIEACDSTADIYAHGFFDNVAQAAQINVAAAEIGVEGRHLRQRIALGLQLKLARRQHACVRGEPGHQGGREVGAIGDVLRAQVQVIDRDFRSLLAREASDADFAVRQKGR